MNIVNDVTKIVERCPSPRFIYPSSPDRGLDTLLDLWPQIRKEFPQATLHIFYGFSNWEKSIKNGNVDEESKQMYHKIQETINQSGIHNHGAVNQTTLAEVWKLMQVWAYPTRFWETYCITALEAQLSETAIVCSDLAGLQSTVADRGILVPGDAYALEYHECFLEEVCAILRDEKRREEMLIKAKAWAQEQTWANRAKEWIDIFGVSPQAPAASYYEDVAKLKEIYDPAYYPAK